MAAWAGSTLQNYPVLAIFGKIRTENRAKTAVPSERAVILLKQLAFLMSMNIVSPLTSAICLRNTLKMAQECCIWLEAVQ